MSKFFNRRNNFSSMFLGGMIWIAKHFRGQTWEAKYFNGAKKKKT